MERKKKPSPIQGHSSITISVSFLQSIWLSSKFLSLREYFWGAQKVIISVSKIKGSRNHDTYEVPRNFFLP